MQEKKIWSFPQGSLRIQLMKPELAMPDNMMVAVQGTTMYYYYRAHHHTNSRPRKALISWDRAQDDDDNSNLPGCNWSVQ